MSQMAVSAETLQRIPSFVAAQLQSYIARNQAIWELREQRVTPFDFERPLFRTEGYYSYWMRGSHYWLEQNPSRVAVCPAVPDATPSDDWRHIDMWVIAWDTNEDDTVDEFVVAALQIVEEKRT